MTLNNWLKTIAISAALISLVACSTSQPDASANGNGAAYGANANGIGEGTCFSSDDENIPGHSSLRVENQSYFFDFDQSSVHDADVASVKVQAHYLATHPHAKILLTGNTDERGSREYNIGLGERRANSVAALLEANGVCKGQITVVSYGAEKPVGLGHDEASYTKNRRVDLLYQTRIGRNKED